MGKIGKATYSRDGKNRFTLRIDYRIGLTEIAAAIAYELDGTTSLEDLTTTKYGLMQLTRDYYQHFGYSGLESAPITPEIENFITKIFPELITEKNF